MYLKACFQSTSRIRIIHSLTLVSILAMLCCIFQACDNSIMHEELHHIEKSQWKATDTVFFHFTVTDTTKPYDFGFNIRNTTSYDYQNLYLFITAWYPGGTWSRDTAECILSAPDGKWYGKGMGKIKDSRFVFRKGVRFRRLGNYTIGVNQAMRIELLQGISDVGIRIVKTSNDSQ
jgi:gliding motility-associated lipoprotein GldH